MPSEMSRYCFSCFPSMVCAVDSHGFDSTQQAALTPLHRDMLERCQLHV